VHMNGTAVRSSWSTVAAAPRTGHRPCGHPGTAMPGSPTVPCRPSPAQWPIAGSARRRSLVKDPAALFLVWRKRQIRANCMPSGLRVLVSVPGPLSPMEPFWPTRLKAVIQDAHGISLLLLRPAALICSWRKRMSSIMPIPIMAAPGPRQRLPPTSTPPMVLSAGCVWQQTVPREATKLS